MRSMSSSPTLVALGTFLAFWCYALSAAATASQVPILDYNYTGGPLVRDSFLDSVNAPQWIAKMKASFTQSKMELVEQDVVNLGGTVRSTMYRLKMITFDSSAEVLESIMQTWGDRFEYLVPNMLVTETAVRHGGR